MLRSLSSFRSLLHLSGRLLRPPNPRFPGPLNPSLPSSPHSPRFLSASPSPAGGARWATYDDDPLIESLCASASDTPADSDVWAVFDPVSGRIIIQRHPPSSSSTGEEKEGEGEGAGEREDKEKLGVKEAEKGRWKLNRKGRASASDDKGQISRPSVAAGRKPAGKGGKEKVSYVCSNCEEEHSQWWDTCRHCKAPRTLEKICEIVLQGDGGPSEEGVEEGEGAGEEKAGVREKEKWMGKGKGKRKGRASTSGEKGQTSPPLDAAVRKSAGKGGMAKVWFVCSNCGEGHPRWWGFCRHCNVPGTVQRSREMVPPSVREVN